LVVPYVQLIIVIKFIIKFFIKNANQKYKSIQYNYTILYIFSIKFICKKNEFLYTLARTMQPTLNTSHPENPTNPVGTIALEGGNTTHATTEHAGPHIPSSK
jgi:hypothetical protein